MGSRCQSVVSVGADGIIIDIECHVSNNLPTIVIVGFASRAVHEAKDRLRGAFASSQLTLPRRRITINLAPADVPKAESSLDLAIASAIICCDDSAGTLQLPANAAIIGELSLDGSVRPVRGIIGKLLHARSRGKCSFFVPEANVAQAQLIPGITLYPVAHLRQMYDHLHGIADIPALLSGDGQQQLPTATGIQTVVRLDDIVGQASAKRALVIAAAGGHNLFLTGPPGTGKSMLAKALPSLLPPMNHEETLEVTHLTSLAGSDFQQLSRQRPLRSPHHSMSHTAMVGGGRLLRPGEISLSHRGVLLLDEFPEFSRPTIEALRQPLEDQVISVARAGGSARYPANFMLVATANPCPCGYYGFSEDRCECTIARRRTYEQHLSGPVMDRIDLYCDVHLVDYKRLLGQNSDGAAHTLAQQQIAAARLRQAERHASPTLLNSDLSNQQLRRHAKLDRAGLIAMQDAAHKLRLSARGYMRTVKVARTIADLDAADIIGRRHISEALSYRQRPFP